MKPWILSWKAVEPIFFQWILSTSSLHHCRIIATFPNVLQNKMKTTVTGKSDFVFFFNFSQHSYSFGSIVEFPDCRTSHPPAKQWNLYLYLYFYLYCQQLDHYSYLYLYLYLYFQTVGSLFVLVFVLPTSGSLFFTHFYI